MTITPLQLADVMAEIANELGHEVHRNARTGEVSIYNVEFIRLDLMAMELLSRLEARHEA